MSVPPPQEFCVAFKPRGRRSRIAAASHAGARAERRGRAQRQPAAARLMPTEAPSSRRAGARAAQPPREACGPSPRARLAPGVFCAAGCPPGARVARLTPALSCAAGSMARRRHRRRQQNGGAFRPAPRLSASSLPCLRRRLPITANAPRLILVVSCAAGSPPGRRRRARRQGAPACAQPAYAYMVDRRG